MAKIEAWRFRCRMGLAILYGVAGVLHIAVPGPFVSITPHWVPDVEEVILLTGICEIAGAIGLLVPTTRRFAGAALALYAVCVFPANIGHAIDNIAMHGMSIWPWLYHMPRLALQPALVWVALFAGGLAARPFRT